MKRRKKKVEARNFEIRKNLLKYDDVMNDQRKVVFEQRNEVLDSTDLHELIAEMREEVIDNMVDHYIPAGTYSEQWKPAELAEDLRQTLHLDLPIEDWSHEEGIGEEQILERVREALEARVKERDERFGPELMQYFQKAMLLETIDTLWREHLGNLDHLRSAVGFRGYAQRDPLNEYKTESFELFQNMLINLRRDVVSKLMRFEIIQEAPSPQLPPMTENHPEADEFGSFEEAALAIPFEEERIVDPADRDANDPETWGKVGRNEQCPCGSGKKYKHCHGVLRA